MKRGILKTLVALALSVGAIRADAQDAPTEQPRLSFGQLLKDPEDGKFDVSAYLGKGGVVPLPFVITEPALGKGLGLALAFVDNSRVAGGDEPTLSLLGYAGTTNGSEMVMAARRGSLGGGAFKYTAALVQGSVNLTFFPNGRLIPLAFNNKADFAYFEGQKRIGNGDLYLGASVTLNNSSISPDPKNGNPLPPSLARSFKQRALGVVGTYDTRDNHLTPSEGMNLNFGIKRFSPSLGSETDFTAARAFGAFFHSPNENWTFSGMAFWEGTFGDTPFFMEPSISLRGVPYNRYQGDQVISTEIELRRQLNERWAVVGFAGYGRTSSANSPLIGGNYEAAVYGAGVRYLLARKLGLDIGIDYAVGPEYRIWYITFGHAWARMMK